MTLVYSIKLHTDTFIINFRDFKSIGFYIGTLTETNILKIKHMLLLGHSVKDGRLENRKSIK